MAIDRLEFVGSDLTVIGPTHAPQTRPSLPQISANSSSGSGLFSKWNCHGKWDFRAGSAFQREPDGYAEAALDISLQSGAVIELWLGSTEPERDWVVRGMFRIWRRNHGTGSCSSDRIEFRIEE
jgi:hypothetical protein